MGWRKKVRLLAGESVERRLLVLVVVEGDEGRGRGSSLWVMNRLQVWSLVRPAWELVCRTISSPNGEAGSYRQE